MEFVHINTYAPLLDSFFFFIIYKAEYSNNISRMNMSKKIGQDNIMKRDKNITKVGPQGISGIICNIRDNLIRHKISLSKDTVKKNN